MIAELWRWLLVSTVASSLAIMLVLLLRKPLRRLVGVRAAYGLWLLPLAALIACFLPVPASNPFGVAWVVADLGLATRSDVGMAETGSGLGLAFIGIAIWSLGCGVMATRLVLAQQRLRRQLGTLSLQGDGTWRSDADPEFGPAVIGVWPSRIVLPQSFASMWSPRQQPQVLAHERCHVERRDLWVQLLALVWLCLYWFNPLVHRAVRSLRIDQELACDATVVGRRPQMIRDYAEALLATAQRDIRAPLCNAWTDPGPLKERISMLGQSHRNRWTHRVALCAIVVAALLSGVSVWSMQAGGGTGESDEAAESLLVVDLDFRLLQGAADSDGADGRKLQLLVRPNEESVVSSDHAANPWRLMLRVSPTQQGHFIVAMTLTVREQMMAAPSITLLPGKDGSIEVHNLFRVELRVSRLTVDNDPRTTTGTTNRG